MVFTNAHHHLADLCKYLQQEPAILVTVEASRGSVPRDAGTWMAVFSTSLTGTIGGGHLEYEAISKARAMLHSRAPTAEARGRFALGPSLGQCCGGVVDLVFQTINTSDLPSLIRRLQPPASPVALFGGGHVGHAVARVLVNLPFALTWIDSREGVFPDPVPANVVCEYSDPVQTAVPHLQPGSRVLIMSFSHAEDLDVVAACLERQRKSADLPYIGLIGSRTKWATFRQRLEARGFSAAEMASVTSPIGVPGIKGKEPDVIAIAVAAQLLQSVCQP